MENGQGRQFLAICGLCVHEQKLLFTSFGSCRKETVNVVEFSTVIFQNFYQIEN